MGSSGSEVLDKAAKEILRKAVNDFPSVPDFFRGIFMTARSQLFSDTGTGSAIDETFVTFAQLCTSKYERNYLTHLNCFCYSDVNRREL